MICTILSSPGKNSSVTKSASRTSRIVMRIGMMQIRTVLPSAVRKAGSLKIST